MGRPRHSRNAHIHVLVSDEENRKLDELASANGVDRSGIIRWMIARLHREQMAEAASR
jgi:predicted transcriptional regulator